MITQFLILDLFLCLHPGLPEEHPGQPAVCGSVRAVDGCDGGGGGRGEDTSCPKVRSLLEAHSDACSIHQIILCVSCRAQTDTTSHTDVRYL